MNHVALRRALLALVALFTAAALVAYLVLGTALRGTLLVLGAAAGCASAVVWIGAPLKERRVLLARVRVGAAAGIVATLAYDVTKFAVARLIRSPRNPFETVRLFGVLLAGRAAPAAVVDAAGATYHFTNGAAFGVAFSILLGRRGATAGVLWGLGLELMQLLLYPRWLHLDALGEFTVVSLAGHTTYGLVLGSLCRRGLHARTQAAFSVDAGEASRRP